MGDFFEEQFEGQATLAAAKTAPAKKTGSNQEEGQLTVDVYQTEDDIVIMSAIAGVTADDMDIAITNDMVTIKGKRSFDRAIDESDYYYQELYWGPFSRSIILPEDIDVEKANASMKNGVLTIRLPKLAKSRMKKVKISS
jgi:HSP20 family protein